MSKMKLIAGISALFFVSCMMLVFTGCGEPPVSLLIENKYHYEPETYAKPDHTPREFEEYEKILKSIPLDFSEVNHNFSDMDTVRNHKAWIVDLFHQVIKGKRELYVLFNNHHVLRLTGSQLVLEWTVELEGRPSSPPAITDNDIVWLTDTNVITWYFRDRQPNQNQMRYTKVLSVTPASPIAANESGAYLSASEHFRMFGYDERHKLEKWYWPTAGIGIGTITMTPFADHDRLYFYNNNGNVYCISSDDGSKKWEFDVTHMNANFAVKDAGNDKLFFIPSWSTKLFCMNTAREIYWSFHAQEPIVSTPFVEDSVDNEHYVIFQTPRYLNCIKYYYSADVKGSKGWIRLVDADNPEGRKANEPVWQIPLVADVYLPGGKEATKYTDDEILKLEYRRKFKSLLIGKKYLYVLQYVQMEDDGKMVDKKFIRRIELETGEMEKEGYDVTKFPIIVGSNNEDDRSIYFATSEGYLFVMSIPPN